MVIKKKSDEIQAYLTDASNFKGNCSGVFIPENISELKEIVRNCNEKKQLLTISGNGTGLTGGRVAESGVVVSMERLDKILEINSREKYAVVQPGVILSDFNNAVKERDLYYPPDPTEQNCFIGATIATNASGAKSFKYGPTRNFVEEVSVILPDGDSVTIPRGKYPAEDYKLKFTTDSGKEIEINIPEIEMPQIKHAAGYFCKKGMDLIDLFIGSEGTLGIITEAKLRLIDFPKNFLSAVIFFSSGNDALQFVSEARKLSRTGNEKINALGIEFFDNNSLEFLKDDYPNIPGDADAAVWFEQDYDSDEEEEVFDSWMDLTERSSGDLENSWFASDNSDRIKFIDFRHAVSWKVSDFISKHNIRKVGTDLAVPDKNFDEFYHSSRTLVEESGINFIAYGHFGDSHLHLNMLPADDNEFKKAKDIYKQLCLLAIKLGGTVSAEHGIGKIKREYLLDMFGKEKISRMALIKTTLDPNKILNIGNIFYEEFL